MAEDLQAGTGLFELLVVRDPARIEAGTLLPAQVSDDELKSGKRTPVDLFSGTSSSPISRLVYEMVFCTAPPPEQGTTDVPATVVASEQAAPTVRSRNLAIVEAVVGLLPPRYAPCPEREPPVAGAAPIPVETLVDRRYFEQGGAVFLLPDRDSDIDAEFADRMSQARSAMLSATRDDQIAYLPAALAKIFRVPVLRDFVFNMGEHQPEFLRLRRRAFDTLYLLYVLRRAFEVGLESPIEWLRTLNAVEALAIDEYIADLRRVRGPSIDGGALLSTLTRLHPQLEGWDFSAEVPGLPLMGSATAVRRRLESPVVVHPLFARLHGFRTPFNGIRPIGIGDLKVVKQTSLEYFAGDVAHIDNVMRRELKTRVHRRLEKSEDTFTFNSEQSRENQRDTQSSDRFELKREAESSINSVLNINANASLTYNGATVVASVSGGVAYSRTSNEVEKAAQNFARDVVDKAVTRVQNRVSEQRTSVRLLETEETNTHTFDNKDGTSHVSGIYRWVERRYRAQVWNYGKRLMFEFVVPEPAAFLIESRMRAFEATLDVPQPPTAPSATPLPQNVLALRPERIDEQLFRDLQRDYDLAEFTFPPRMFRAHLVNDATGNNYYSERNLDPMAWVGRTYTSRVPGIAGYRLTMVAVSARLFFWGSDSQGVGSDVAGNPADDNSFEIHVNGHPVRNTAAPGWVDNTQENWVLNQVPIGVVDMPILASDTLTLFFGFRDIQLFDVSIHAQFEIDDAKLYPWQVAVYRKIVSIEREKAAAIDARRQQTYEADFARYRARLAEVKAVAMSELLSGQSSSANRQLILEELKKHCVTMIAREFDADLTDDVLTGLYAIGARNIPTLIRPFVIDESGSRTTAGYRPRSTALPFPSIDLEKARAKGRYVQFLEQAFEWQQIAFILYPYFWGRSELWMEAMSRNDTADPQYAAFLRAGSARVLVAATPGYEDAVLHFLATGEPWDGGPAPVIGDPLFLPLHEELRRQTDDRQGAVKDGLPWEFTLPTSLVYLEGSSTPLPGPPPAT